MDQNDVLKSMSDLSSFITKEKDTFYFDVGEINENSPLFGIDYQSGDIIRWKWENKKYTGTLRQLGYNSDLFVLQNVTESSK